MAQRYEYQRLPKFLAKHACYALTACNSDWKASENLKNDPEKYVRQIIKKREILDYVKRDYPEYRWSAAELGRRLRYFDIKYIDYDTPLDVVTNEVSKQLNGPGRYFDRVLPRFRRLDKGTKTGSYNEYSAP